MEFEVGQFIYHSENQEEVAVITDKIVSNGKIYYDIKLLGIPNTLKSIPEEDLQETINNGSIAVFKPEMQKTLKILYY